MSESEIKDGICEIVDIYDAELARRDHQPIRNGNKREHLRWMCQEIKETHVNEDLYKANRWLGFVQGMLVAEGIYSIDQLREQTRSALAPAQ